MVDLDELRAELEEFAQPEKKSGRSPREERIIAGFEEIQRFFEQHGHAPQHGENNDIFERLYAVRLDRLRELEECRLLLAPLDHQKLLSDSYVREPKPEYSLSDDELMAELEGAAGSSDITELRHVRSRVEIQTAEEIANREKCDDFEQFESLFKRVESDLKLGLRKTMRFGQDAAINKGEFFILYGQIVYVDKKEDEFTTPQGHPDARLRVIYSNGTESNLLLRSLQRALYKDDAGRRITDPDAGPLFSETLEEDDIESGTIYVLRSLSSHPFVAEHRELIHKIGVTGGKVETRIAAAVTDATYLLADVEVVATYKLHNVNRMRLENIFHRLFSAAQIDLTISDRFGKPVKPKEWFLVPIHVIDEVVKRILDGSIASMMYDVNTARLILAK